MSPSILRAAQGRQLHKNLSMKPVTLLRSPPQMSSNLRLHRDGEGQVGNYYETFLDSCKETCFQDDDEDDDLADVTPPRRDLAEVTPPPARRFLDNMDEEEEQISPPAANATGTGGVGSDDSL